MDVNKKKLYPLLLLLGILSSVITSIEAVLPRPATELFFLPAMQGQIRSKLYNFLDTAQSSIKIAVYWLTDRDLINKLIQLKKKGINIEVIIDESTFKRIGSRRIRREDIIDPLINNDINTLVFPSNSVQGKMHNKYVIIDQKAVWTGSANFTKTVLDASMRRINEENILILHSPELASCYAQNFEEIKIEVLEKEFNELINIVANTAYFNIPKSIAQDVKSLWYQEEYTLFKELVNDYLLDPRNTAKQKTFLKNYLGIDPTESIRMKRSREYYSSSDEDTDDEERISQCVVDEPQLRLKSATPPLLPSQERVKPFRQFPEVPSQTMQRSESAEEFPINLSQEDEARLSEFIHMPSPSLRSQEQSPTPLSQEQLRFSSQFPTIPSQTKLKSETPSIPSSQEEELPFFYDSSSP